MSMAYIHRHLRVVLLMHFGLVNQSLSKLEEIGGLQMEKTELMVRTMERAVEERDVMEEVVEKGVYWTVRHQLSEGHEEKLKALVNIEVAT